MKKNKISEFLNILRKVSEKIFIISVYLSLSLFLLFLIAGMANKNFVIKTSLSIVDEYLKIVITSWPAAILIIGLTLLMRHRKAIDYFIKKRMTGIGLDGVKGSIIETKASDEDIAGKSIVETKEEDEINIEIRKNVTKPIPNTIKKEVYERAQRNYEVEDLVQKKLLEEYDDTYTSNVKLIISNGKSQILDGVFETYSGGKIAVEIKYLGLNKNPEGLKYQIKRLKEKLLDFGIKNLKFIVVADDLSVDEARAIRSSVTARVKIYFYSLEKDGSLNSINIKKEKKKSLF